MIAARSSIAVFALLVAGCGGAPKHGFTDVVETKPSPDGALVAALVWEERGPAAPHLSGVVVVARGTDPRTGDAVILTGDDFHPIDFAWTGPAALTLRLPCGRWSHLANHAIAGARTVMVTATPARGCYVGPAGTGALPGPGL